MYLSKMKIGNYEIKPVSIFLPDEKSRLDEYEKAKIYFAEQRIEDILWVKGIHAHKFGVQGRHIYLLDNRPEEQFYFGDANVGCYLSMYMIYNMMNVMDYSHYLFLEPDCVFVDGWKEKLEEALADIPSDFDFLFPGSCCAEDKQSVHVKGNLYHFPYRGEEMWRYYPQCGHCLLIAKKCLPHLIATNRDVASPIDISLIRHSFGALNIYAILPRIASQGTKTDLPK